MSRPVGTIRDSPRGRMLHSTPRQERENENGVLVVTKRD